MVRRNAYKGSKRTLLRAELRLVNEILGRSADILDDHLSD